MQRIALITAIAALAAVIYLMQRLGRTERELAIMKAMTTTQPVGAAEGEERRELEVAVHMGRIQQYAHKLWAAGKAANLPLAGFYVHEMDEAMEELEHANIDDDGVPVSKHMQTYGIRAVDEFASDLKANGLKHFDEQFATLVNTCNSCHDKCGYPFIRVALPLGPPSGPQDFRP